MLVVITLCGGAGGFLWSIMQTNISAAHNESVQLNESTEQHIGRAEAAMESSIALIKSGSSRAIESVDKASVERHTDALAATTALGVRVEHLEEWQTAQVKADLDELRQRRMKDSK